MLIFIWCAFDKAETQDMLKVSSEDGVIFMFLLEGPVPDLIFPQECIGA